MSGELINPILIPGTDIVASQISASAETYRSTATSIGASADAVLASWSGLSGVYTAPESAQLLAAMDPAGADAHTVATTLTSASGLLSDLAEAVVAPVNRLKQLKQEAEEFVASVRGGVTVSFGDSDYPRIGTVVPPTNPPDESIGWAEHTPSVDRNNQLLEQVATESAKLLAASTDCVNGINALRTDICIAPQDAVTAEQLIAAEGLPWGEIGKGDRSCSESVNDGMFEFGKGIVGGVVALGGWNIDDGWAWSTDFAGQAWTGLASGLGALVITVGNPANIALAYVPEEYVPEHLQGVQTWYRSNLENIVGGIVGTPEQWEEDPVAAGTYAVLSIGTFFIPVAGQAGAAAKVASSLARAATATGRIAGIVFDGGRLANGLTHTGTLFTRLSTAVDGLTGSTPGVRGLTEVAAALDDIPNVIPDNLIPARAAVELSTPVVREPALVGANRIGADQVGAPTPGTTRQVADQVPGGTVSETPRNSTGASGGRGETQVLDRPTPPDDGASGTDTGGHATGGDQLVGGRNVAAGGDRLNGGDAPGAASRLNDTTGGDGWQPLTSEQIAELPVVRDGTHLNPDGSLQPNTWYHAGEHEYIYHTNEHGHIDRAIAEDLHFTDRLTRLTHDPSTLGKLPGDHAGHLFGDRYGGSPKLDNLVSQLSDINLSKYKIIENEWARTLTSVPPGTVSVDIRIITNPTTGRPTRFEIDSILDGKSKFTRLDQ